jgi:hypothetical protein
MAKKTAQTFAKRQKELARKEKQQQKAQKRQERKVEKSTRPEGSGDPDIDWIVPGPQPVMEDV